MVAGEVISFTKLGDMLPPECLLKQKDGNATVYKAGKAYLASNTISDTKGDSLSQAKQQTVPFA